MQQHWQSGLCSTIVTPPSLHHHHHLGDHQWDKHQERQWRIPFSFHVYHQRFIEYLVYAPVKIGKNGRKWVLACFAHLLVPDHPLPHIFLKNQVKY